jgi:hypothetical protein
MWKKPILSLGIRFSSTIGWFCVLLCFSGSAVAAWDNPLPERILPQQDSYLTFGWWRLYNLPELQGIAVSGGLSIAGSQLQLQLNQFGWPAYREWGGNVGWRTRWQQLQGGVYANFHRLQVRGYPPLQAMNSSCFLLYKTDSSWYAGVALKNWLPPGCGELASAQFDFSLQAARWLQLQLSWIEQHTGSGALLGWQGLIPGKSSPQLEYNYDTRSGQSMLALRLRKGRIGWRIALLLHPQLGCSQHLLSEFYF